MTAVLLIEYANLLTKTCLLLDNNIFLFQIKFQSRKSKVTMSSVWKHFERGRDDDNVKTGTCRLCETIIRCCGSTTSGLWLHLQKRHEKEYAKLNDKTLKTAKSTSATLKQPSVASMIASKIPYKPDHPTQKKFDKNVINLIIYNGIPFNMASSQYFKKMVGDLDPRVKVKTRKTYSTYIRNMEIATKRKIKTLIQNYAKGMVALTSDLWDDKKQNAFCSLTVHFINNEFKLSRVTPAIKYFGTGRHTSINIADVLAKEIKEVIDDENDPTVVITTDSANNMVRARKLLVEKKVVDQYLGCANHKLQNCIKKAFKKTESVKKTLAKAKKLANHIRKSSLANNRLKKACEKTNHKYLRIKSCIDIRWNTQLDCFERLLYHQECLEEMDRKKELESVSESVLTRMQWRRLEKLVEILNPLKVDTKVLESEKEPTINRVAEIIFDESARLKEIINGDNEDCIKEFARHLLADIKNRFPKLGFHDLTVRYANFLDPRLKGIHLRETNELETTRADIERHLSTFDEGTEGVEEGDEEKDINENLTATQKLLQVEGSSSTSVEMTPKYTKTAKREIEVYLKSPALLPNQSVLDWWRSHMELLPKLSALASMILAVPASSSASERLFSVAGCFDSLKRGRLRLETLETLTLLKTNKEILEENNIDIGEIMCGANESEDTGSESSSDESEDESGGSEKDGDGSDGDEAHESGDEAQGEDE